MAEGTKKVSLGDRVMNLIILCIVMPLFAWITAVSWAMLDSCKNLWLILSEGGFFVASILFFVLGLYVLFLSIALFFKPDVGKNMQIGKYIAWSSIFLLLYGFAWLTVLVTLTPGSAVGCL